MDKLITLDTVVAINSARRHVIKDIQDGFPGEEMLQKVLIDQVAQAEVQLLAAVENLLGKYEHAQMSAWAHRRSPELEDVLSSLYGITTEDNG